MTTYFITRHTGAKQWAEQQGFPIDRMLQHLDTNHIQPGDIVIGSLPVNLAAEVCAKGARYIHICLDLPFESRGKELSTDDMQRLGAKLQAYQIGRAHV